MEKCDWAVAHAWAEIYRLKRQICHSEWILYYTKQHTWWFRLDTQCSPFYASKFQALPKMPMLSCAWRKRNNVTLSLYTIFYIDAQKGSAQFALWLLICNHLSQPFRCPRIVFAIKYDGTVVAPRLTNDERMRERGHNEWWTAIKFNSRYLNVDISSTIYALKLNVEKHLMLNHITIIIWKIAELDWICVLIKLTFIFIEPMMRCIDWNKSGTNLRC